MATKVPFPKDVSETTESYSRNVKWAFDYDPFELPVRRMTPGQLARYGLWSLAVGVTSLVLALWRKVS